MTYTDDKHETQWYKWYDLPRYQQLHLALKEGVIWSGSGTTDASGPNYNPHRYQWPKYRWQRPQMRTTIDNVWSQGKIGQAGVFDVDATGDGAVTAPTRAWPSGIFWDPLNCPDEIGELRAGKNSISFSFTPCDADQGKMFNLDAIASFGQWTTDGPFCGVGRPGQWIETTTMDPDQACTFGLAEKQPNTAGVGSGNTNVTDYDDYTIPNMYNLPIMPTKWFWIEQGRSIIDSMEENEPASNRGWTQVKNWRKGNKYYPGTEYEAATYPPCQWFTKGIPLFDATTSQIKTTTQVSFQISITLEGKKRRSAYYAPTHGPWSGDQLYYHTNKRGIFQPSCIRYKTGGKRRTWQNIQALLVTQDKNSNYATQNVSNVKKHPRMDNYLYNPNAASANDLFYTVAHRPLGIPDNTGHSTLKTTQPTGIRVKWTRETDSTEIIMDEESQE